jgi:hypothetical protein
MSTLVNVVLVVLAAVGVLWMFQGANLLGGSFMSGRSEWLYAGAVMTIASLAALWWFNRRRARARG